MDEDLDFRIQKVCGVLNVAHAQLVTLIAEAVDGGVWQVPGIRSIEHWVSWKTGVSPSRAKQLVHIASRATELPVTLRTFADGELAVDQVTVIARHIPAHNDAEVADVARHATVSQLGSMLGSYWKGSKPTPPADDQGGETDDEPTVEPVAPSPVDEPVDTVYAYFDEHGRYRIHADLSPERGAVIDKALDEARDALMRDGHRDVTQADALEQVCLRSLGTITSVSRTDRYRVLVHIDEHGAWLNGGPRLTDRTLRSILSNTILQSVFEQAGRPVNLGRSARVVPHRIAALIADRDRTCRNPLCNATRRLEVHHVKHWIDGGRTDTANLACLCPACHRAHHKGEFTISGNADLPGGLTFTRPNGTIITGAANPQPPDGPLPQPAKPYCHPTGEPWSRRDTQFTPPPHTQPSIWPRPTPKPVPTRDTAAIVHRPPPEPNPENPWHAVLRHHQDLARAELAQAAAS